MPAAFPAQDGCGFERLPRSAGSGGASAATARRRYLLDLVTGNTEPAAHIKLHRAQLNRFFSFGGYGSDSNDRSELTRIAHERASLTYGAKVAAGEIIVVGDTPHDVESAHAAGLECIGVGSHKFDIDELREAGADYPVASLADELPI